MKKPSLDRMLEKSVELTENARNRREAIQPMIDELIDIKVLLMKIEEELRAILKVIDK